MIVMSWDPIPQSVTLSHSSAPASLALAARNVIDVNQGSGTSGVFSSAISDADVSTT